MGRLYYHGHIYQLDKEYERELETLHKILLGLDDTLAKLQKADNIQTMKKTIHGIRLELGGVRFSLLGPGKGTTGRKGKHFKEEYQPLGRFD